MSRLQQKALVVLTVLGMSATGAVSAEEKYFLLLFASQADPVAPRTSHTFATFVKATGNGADMKKWKIETRTISWMPIGRSVMPRFARERGQNFDLVATLAWTKSQSARMSLWGPFEVDRELHESAERQIERLESGVLPYHLLNGGLRPASGLNCMHAVSDLAPGERLASGIAYGEAGSAAVLRHLRRWIPNPQPTHDWLIERLELKEQNLQRRAG